MKKASVWVAMLALAIGGCGLIDDLKSDLSKIKNSIDDIKAVASGDIGAANAALEGAGVSVDGALGEAQKALADSGVGAAGKPGFLPQAVEKVSAIKTRDCPLGGSVERTIEVDYQPLQKAADITVELEADNCILTLSDLDDGRPTIASVTVAGGASVTTVTIAGENFGAPSTTTETDDETFAVFFTPVTGDTSVYIVPSDGASGVVQTWTADEIVIHLPDTIWRGNQRIVVEAGERPSRGLNVNLAQNGTTSAPIPTVESAEAEGIATLNGSQTIAVRVGVVVDGDKLKLDGIETIAFSAPDWSSIVEDEDVVISELVYTDFELTGATEDGTLNLTLNGRQNALTAVHSIDARYDGLNVKLGPKGEADRAEMSVDGGIKLGISVETLQCIDAEYKFTTVEPLLTDRKTCPEAGVLIVEEILAEGESVSVEYTFTGNGKVSFSGSDGAEEFPCSELGSPTAGCFAPK